MIIIINKNASKSMKTRLKAMGYMVIDSMFSHNLPIATAAHPDMQIHPLRHDLAIVPPSCFEYYRNKLPDSIKLLQGEKELKGTYPGDCAYNVTRLNNIVFCNRKHTSGKLLQYYQGESVQIVHVNQGYTKCSMAVLENDCIVTEDVGIHKTIIANKLPIQSVLVPKGEVTLKGFSYGFIGGACGGIKKQIFWYGSPEFCSYYSVLEEEATKRKIQNIALEKKQLDDLGGIICFPK